MDNKQLRVVFFSIIFLFILLGLYIHFNRANSSPQEVIQSDSLNSIDSRVKVLNGGLDYSPAGSAEEKCYSEAKSQYMSSMIFECLQAGKERDCTENELKREIVETIVKDLDESINKCQALSIK